jgi:hypothetical protein
MSDWEDTGIAVRAYPDGGRGFEEDAAAFARVGFFPSTVTHQPQPAGLVRGLLLNVMALVWTPPHHLIVTYVRK